MLGWWDVGRPKSYALAVRGTAGTGSSSLTRESAFAEQAELTQHGDTVVQADLLGDQTVSTLRMGVPVNRIVLPVFASGRPPSGRSVIGSPMCVPPPIHWPTT